MVRPSGPVARELLLFSIAGETLSSGHSLKSLRLTIRADGSRGNRGGGELFSKSCCYFSISGDEFGVKVEELIGRGSGSFTLRDFIMLHRREGLHLCEHDSTVWVNFCLLESAM